MAEIEWGYIIRLLVKLMSHKKQAINNTMIPPLSTVRHDPPIRQTPRALLPFIMHVCVHLCVSTCCTQCKHGQTAQWL